jgi:hypothetical protein
MQKLLIALTTACCVILALIDLYLNYRLYELTNRGGDTPAVTASEPSPFIQTAADDAFLTLNESFYTEQRELPAPQDQNAAAEGNPPAAADTQPLYQLGIQDGYITVYYGGGPVKEVTARPTDALPFDEKLRLSEGIPVYNETELARLLQDYGS